LSGAERRQDGSIRDPAGSFAGSGESQGRLSHIDQLRTSLDLVIEPGGVLETTRAADDCDVRRAFGSQRLEFQPEFIPIGRDEVISPRIKPLPKKSHVPNPDPVNRPRCVA
jgi:hypothetical protein